MGDSKMSETVYQEVHSQTQMKTDVQLNTLPKAVDSSDGRAGIWI